MMSLMDNESGHQLLVRTNNEQPEQLAAESERFCVHCPLKLNPSAQDRLTASGAKKEGTHVWCSSSYPLATAWSQVSIFFNKKIFLHKKDILKFIF